MGARFTQEHKTKFLSRVNQLRNEGMNLNDAVTKAGHSLATYRSWKKEIGSNVVFHKTPKTKRKYTKRIKIAENSETKIALFLCTPSQAAAIIKGL